ncbi:MAG: exosome complex exonuclease Rrp41 [Candidatus Aenigmatarchaeota archaeon]
MAEEIESFLEDGKRLDGRELDELREMEAEASLLKRADGSGYFRMGDTEAVAAVYGPRELHPQHLQDARKALLRCRYNLAPFSTEDRVRPGPSRRATEINKVIKEALSPVVFLERYPNAVVDVYMEVISADAGTRCVALNAASIALADAGIPMKSIISACAAGKIDGKPALDIMGEEDKYGEVDLPIALNPDNDEITLLQMDGIADLDEIKEIMELAKQGCREVSKVQKKALRESFDG